VGGLLPGVEIRLERIEGISHGGRLLVRGPNIMAGYLTADGGVDPPEGGWHDTGDVVEVSDDRWVRIIGRAKRFAKVAGEMVSLTAAEDLASAVWPHARHAVVAIEDPRKGERLVLVTDHRDAEVSPLLAHAQAVGAPEIAAPRKIIKVPEVPVLGSGKTDYVAVQRIVDAEGPSFRAA
jgi:acyl-[acyl-carrier-protein]-phospholipid O-acyltransferase/long-chain-fatty-acid--[acyl-carrier-protein] ligase